MHDFERVTPESVGIHSKTLTRFYKEMEINKYPIHNFILLRHGKLVTQGSWYPYRRDMNHMIYSTSKTVCALAIGFCIQEGLLSMDDRLVDFFPELITGPIHEFNRERTIRTLLTMTGGETGDASSIDRSYPDWLKTYLNTPPRVKPGTLYGYDNSATHALSAVIQKVSGQKLIDYLRPRLFDPLGVSKDCYWEEQMGINTASRGFHCTIEDLAKIGQFCLQMGEWEGRQLIDRRWMEEATSKQVEVTNFTSRHDGNPGYGYKFWLFRDGAYGTKGNGGQNFICYPRYDILWAFTANLEDSYGRHAGFMHMCWPMLFSDISDGPLPEDPEAYAELLETEKDLQINLCDHMDHISPLEERLYGNTYVMAKNASQFHTVRFEKRENGLRLVFTLGIDRHEWVVDADFGHWLYQPVTETNDHGWGQYIWRNDRVMELTLLIRETLGQYQMIFYINDDNSISIDIYPISWRDMNRLQYFGMGYSWA